VPELYLLRVYCEVLDAAKRNVSHYKEDGEQDHQPMDFAELAGNKA
jgi:hypothetical protein